MLSVHCNDIATSKLDLHCNGIAVLLYHIMYSQVSTNINIYYIKGF
jgi:hypothetical protein